MREHDTSRAYIWDEGKLRETTVKQVLCHRAFVAAAISVPKCLVDGVLDGI